MGFQRLTKGFWWTWKFQTIKQVVLQHRSADIDPSYFKWFKHVFIWNNILNLANLSFFSEFNRLNFISKRFFSSTRDTINVAPTVILFVLWINKFIITLIIRLHTHMWSFLWPSHTAKLFSFLVFIWILYSFFKHLRTKFLIKPWIRRSLILIAIIFLKISYRLEL